jgi:hypothetical protein
MSPEARPTGATRFVVIQCWCYSMLVSFGCSLRRLSPRREGSRSIPLSLLGGPARAIDPFTTRKWTRHSRDRFVFKTRTKARQIMLKLRTLGLSDYSVPEGRQSIGRIRLATERNPGISLWSVSGPPPRRTPDGFSQGSRHGQVGVQNLSFASQRPLKRLNRHLSSNATMAGIKPAVKCSTV